MLKYYENFKTLSLKTLQLIVLTISKNYQINLLRTLQQERFIDGNANGKTCIIMWSFFQQNNWWLEILWNQILLDNIGNEAQVRTISPQGLCDEYQDLKCSITQRLLDEPVALKQIQHLRKQNNCPKCKCKSFISELRLADNTSKTLNRFIKRAKRKGRCWIEQRIANFNYDLEIQSRRID